jgi:hypothetical protein
MDVWDIVWEGAEWIQLAQDRGRWQAVVNAVMNATFWRHVVSYRTSLFHNTNSALMILFSHLHLLFKVVSYTF